MMTVTNGCGGRGFGLPLPRMQFRSNPKERPPCPMVTTDSKAAVVFHVERVGPALSARRNGRHKYNARLEGTISTQSVSDGPFPPRIRRQYTPAAPPRPYPAAPAATASARSADSTEMTAVLVPERPVAHAQGADGAVHGEGGEPMRQAGANPVEKKSDQGQAPGPHRNQKFRIQKTVNLDYSDETTQRKPKS